MGPGGCGEGSTKMAIGHDIEEWCLTDRITLFHRQGLLSGSFGTLTTDLELCRDVTSFDMWDPKVHHRENGQPTNHFLPQHRGGTIYARSIPCRLRLVYATRSMSN